jgi:hypothetical protein
MNEAAFRAVNEENISKAKLLPLSSVSGRTQV